MLLLDGGALPAGVDAEDAHHEDAELQKDKGGGGDNDHGPAGAEDVVGVVVALNENWEKKTACDTLTVVHIMFFLCGR